ncbi:3-phosphoinositide dependent protein kinase-1 [Angomonas deanei]|nr:3-phosphoinositide dependent protein kinase-1 [Angomonas deanei]|eukprot:EPY39505.1 3-phosphoinositide dependent protein kinase-1 [Angomonas deanei]
MSSTSQTTCPQFKVHQLNLATATPLGAGAISHVIKSHLTKPPIPIAIKALSKVQLLQQGKVEGALNEKKALVALGPHPFVERIYGTAQSEDELYFVLEYLPHGDLLQHIRRRHLECQKEYNASAGTGEKGAGTLEKIPASSTMKRCLGFKDIQLITAQLILGIARVVEKGFVLRDLKPENVAFDCKYRACLIDFDTVDLEGKSSKPVTNGGVAVKPEQEKPANTKRRITVSEIQEMRKKSASFCGTAQYVSPEMVGELKWSFSSDLWALGATAYEMMYGEHMFAGITPFEVLKKVVNGVSDAIRFPYIDFGVPDAKERFEALKDFILRLVCVDPMDRLGVDLETQAFDLPGLKGHTLFADFDWSRLEEHLTSFKPHHIPLEGEDEVPVSGDNPDPSPSLMSCYEAVPFNDEQYAEYIFHATADANPFEKFLLDQVERREDTVAPQEDAVKETAEEAPLDFDHVPDGTSSESSSSSLEVIDDVGMRYEYGSVHPDFTK